MFADSESVQESQGVRPFELVNEYSVWGPLQLINEKWSQVNPNRDNHLDYVEQFRIRISAANMLAREPLKCVQSKMKDRYDKKTAEQKFEIATKF